MNLLVKSAKIVDASNKELHLKKRDILIVNGKIAQIASKIEPSPKAKTLELKNLHISIGWFDTGVCFGEPGYEERETLLNGLRTAGTSGFSDIVLNPNTYPVPDTSSDIVFLKNAAKNHVVNLYPLGTLTSKAEGEHLAELFDMKKAGAIGFYDFKQPIASPNLLKIALQYAQNFDGLVCSFPMDMSIAGKGIVNEGVVSTTLGLKGIPGLAEELQIARDLFILEYTGGKLHIPTISSGDSVKLISEAKKKGLDVSCSTALHNLWFTDEALGEFDAKFKVLPPLRTKNDTRMLLKGLKEGVIDFVTTDHWPMNIEQKQVEFDNSAYGTIGLESAFGAMNALLGTEKTVEMLTKGRARFGIRSPKIKEGEMACLTLFDPEKAYRFSLEDVLSTSKNSIFLDSALKGTAYGVINNGQILLK